MYDATANPNAIAKTNEKVSPNDIFGDIFKPLIDGNCVFLGANICFPLLGIISPV
jgi:hypothetical protein